MPVTEMEGVDLLANVIRSGDKIAYNSLATLLSNSTLLSVY